MEFYVMLSTHYRLYESSCGELVYYNDDFEGLQVHRWYSTASLEQLGLWSQHGIWVVRVSMFMV